MQNVSPYVDVTKLKDMVKYTNVTLHLFPWLHIFIPNIINARFVALIFYEMIEWLNKDKWAIECELRL